MRCHVTLRKAVGNPGSVGTLLALRYTSSLAEIELQHTAIGIYFHEKLQRNLLSQCRDCAVERLDQLGTALPGQVQKLAQVSDRRMASQTNSSMRMGEHFDSSKLQQLQTDSIDTARYLTDQFTNRDIFGTVRGKCNNVSLLSYARKGIYTSSCALELGIVSACSANRVGTPRCSFKHTAGWRFSNGILGAVCKLRRLLEGDSRLYGNDYRPASWGEHVLLLQQLLNDLKKQASSSSHQYCSAIA